MKAATITMNIPRIESVPSKGWRDDVIAGRTPRYNMHVQGMATITNPNGESVQRDAQFVISGIARTHSLGGLVDKARWAYQPGRSETLAKARTVTVEGVVKFDVDPDGKIVFDEAGLTQEQASLGLPLLAWHEQGKALVLTDAEYSVKLVDARAGGKKEIVEVSVFGGYSVEEIRVIRGALFGEEADAGITATVGAAARTTKAATKAAVIMDI